MTNFFAVDFLVSDDALAELHVMLDTLINDPDETENWDGLEGVSTTKRFGHVSAENRQAVEALLDMAVLTASCCDDYETVASIDELIESLQEHIGDF